MNQASENIASATPADKAPRTGKSKPAAKQAPARQVATQAERTVVTFATAVRECPDATLISNIVRVFGMDGIEYHAIREATEEHLARSAAILTDNLPADRSERAIEMHLQRIVDAYVRSAHGAGTFYQARAQIARDLNSRLMNDDRDKDRMGVDGTANRADRAREFAAQLALQAYALLAAAAGAVDAYAQVVGSDWKPYVGNSRPAKEVSRQAAVAQMAALGM